MKKIKRDANGVIYNFEMPKELPPSKDGKQETKNSSFGHFFQLTR